MRFAIDPPRLRTMFRASQNLGFDHAWYSSVGLGHPDSGHHPVVSVPRHLTAQHDGGGFPTRRQLLSAVLVGQSWNNQFGGFAASLLAQWILAARREAVAAGTEPVPVHIVQSLAGYFPPDLVGSVRWRVGANLSLPALAFEYGDAAAITLVDIVLFSTAIDARQNPKLWAHELTHVIQYRRWGVDDFAARYVSDSGAVEREAYANANRFEALRTRQHGH